MERERAQQGVIADNTTEWDARVHREQQRKKRLARRAHVGVSAGVLLGLVAATFGFIVQPEKLPAVAAPTLARPKAAEPPQLRIPLDVSFTFKPGQLAGQAQSLAVGLARIWRNGKSEEASDATRSYTAEFERLAGCDLRWIAGRAGPGVWEGTVSLVLSLREITPYVGRAREGKAVVVTAVTCPHERETGAA